LFGYFRERGLETLDRDRDIAAIEIDVSADGVDHRMWRRHFLERSELLFRAGVVFRAEQRRNEPVMRGDFAVVLPLGERVVEESHGVSRLALVTSQ
jgi:hypothetical protein